MTHAGRQILYRVQSRLHEEWAEAVAREESYGAVPNLCEAPFETLSIFDALKIVNALFSGRSVPDISRKVEAKNGKPGQ